MHPLKYAPMCDACFMNGDCHRLWPLWEKELPQDAAALREVASLRQAIQALGQDLRGHGQAQAWLQHGRAAALAGSNAMVSAKSSSPRQGSILEPVPTVGWGSPQYTGSELALRPCSQEGTALGAWHLH